MVTSLKASEKNVGNRGSKLVIGENITVKEQRVDGSWYEYVSSSYLRCTLISLKISYSERKTQIVY